VSEAIALRVAPLPSFEPPTGCVSVTDGTVVSRTKKTLSVCVLVELSLVTTLTAFGAVVFVGPNVYAFEAYGEVVSVRAVPLKPVVLIAGNATCLIPETPPLRIVVAIVKVPVPPFGASGL
jgi:hypothetical protein